jgi:hypothetical protein
MSRNISGIFVVRHLAVLESSPRATNHLIALFRSVLLRGMNSCIVSVDLCRDSSECEKLFYGFVHGKNVGEHFPSYLSSKLLDVTTQVTSLIMRSIICSFIVYPKSNLLALLVIYVALLCQPFIFVLINQSILENRHESCKISGFRREVAENCTLLGHYAASGGS